MPVEIDYDLLPDPPPVVVPDPLLPTLGGGGAYALKYKTDHAERAVDRLLWQFRNSPKLQSYVEIFVTELQYVEDALHEIVTYRNIDKGEGVTLDTIGRLVGRGRNGLADGAYRIGLYAQIRINRSSGAVKDFADVLRISLPDGITYDTVEGVAAVSFVFLEPLTAEQVQAVWLNLRLTKALGIRLELVYSSDPDVAAFEYGTTEDIDDTNTTTGYAVSDLSTGGVWDSVLSA